MLEAHALECTAAPHKRWSSDGDAGQLDTFQCMLEVLVALTVSPAITDAAIPQSHPLQVRTPILAPAPHRSVTRQFHLVELR